MSNPTLFDDPTPTVRSVDQYVQAVIDMFGFDRTEAALGRIKIQMAGPVPQIGERDPDQRTSIGHRSADVRRFSTNSHSARLLLAFEDATNRHHLYAIGHPRVHYGADTDGLTDAEATNRALGLPEDVGLSRWEGCRRRCSDLREAGYIADTGIERDGRIVWAVTDQGRRACNLLRETGWSRPKS